MEFKRRAFLAAGLALTSACGLAATARGRKPLPWAEFKSRFLLPEGRIADSGNGGVSHSEGQGYAMLLAERVGERETFNRLLAWTEATLALPSEALFAWRYEPGKGVTDPNNASDGDILIAWALMRAAVRWRDRRHALRAQAIRAAIRRRLVRVQGPRTLLLPGMTGFEHPGRSTVNLSYYIWPALDSFRAADGAPVWGPLIADGEKLLAEARFGPHQLPVDWTDIADDGRATPAGDKPPRFGFDALRIPLYLALGRRRGGAETIAGFWRSYADQGKTIPAWVDVMSGETAPFPLSSGGYAVAQRLLGQALVPPPQAGKPDYYNAVLRLLAGLS